MSLASRIYHVVALRVPVVYNKYGYHDHDGMLYALEHNECELNELRKRINDRDCFPDEPYRNRPHHLVRPLVLRACVGETIEIHFRNEIRDRSVSMHLVADGYDVQTSDGANIGHNDSSLVKPGRSTIYQWRCEREGVHVFHDMGDVDGSERGTNSHGLFGALVVEPAGSFWTDPTTGDGTPDGLYVDVHRGDGRYSGPTPFLDPCPPPYAPETASFREFVIFFHDEGDVVLPHSWPIKCFPGEDPDELPIDPCSKELGCSDTSHEGLEDSETPTPCQCAGVVEHDGHAAHVMPISYRAEPMEARLMHLWKMMETRRIKGTGCSTTTTFEPNVVDEEQHHSSWLFGDPDTPVFKAYIGDPVRIRLVHAGVKETHVFHLHFYQWHHVPFNHQTPLLDSITISPQTGHTIVPLYGAGGRQGAPGDVIWHCHLYPHFHQGMWGMFRTFDRRHDGAGTFDERNPDYANHYPDHSPIERLVPLPDREPPPYATKDDPGFPGFMVEPEADAKRCTRQRAGIPHEKSPIPPWPYPADESQAHRLGLAVAPMAMPADYDYRPATDAELRQIYRFALDSRYDDNFNKCPEPGWLFCSYVPRGIDGSLRSNCPLPRDREFELSVISKKVVYNRHCWSDEHAHMFIEDTGGRQTTIGTASRKDVEPDRDVPLFIRANHGEFVRLHLRNELLLEFPCTAFDVQQPRCQAVGEPTGECGLHVHLVKFDAICADGASTGWNYLSGPIPGKRMVYRWWVDREFGVCFFHDHLFANFRQRHGLFGALIAEPFGSRYFDPSSQKTEITSGINAVIEYQHEGQPFQFREFCLGLQDFVPLFDQHGHPLHKPNHPGDHGDQGWMAMNYRCEPLRERVMDPRHWFSTKAEGHRISTDIFETYPGEPIRLRLVQGSHEEQHSFQVQGMRWHRFRYDPCSPLKNQQTLGISEAFTFHLAHPGDLSGSYGPGDYLWKTSSCDDLWCGVWGFIRALDPKEKHKLPQLKYAEPQAALPATGSPTDMLARRFRVVAKEKKLVYRTGGYLGDIVDPFGLVFELTHWAEPGGDWQKVCQHEEPFEPLVLRCRQGEWVKVELSNNLPNRRLVPEPWSPLSPEEAEDSKLPHGQCGPPGVRRSVSSHVSMHADMVLYDVQHSDGSNVGENPDQTIGPGQSREYLWKADQALGVVPLYDMADVKNHRHHGLIGALVVEPSGATPRYARKHEPTAKADAREAWYGTRATIEYEGRRHEELVLLIQDGLRCYWNGDVNLPLRDIPPDPNDDGVEFEDAGQKAFNYKTEPLGWFERLRTNCIAGHSTDDHDPDPRPQTPVSLDRPDPQTPLFTVGRDASVWLRLVGACDKPRNHSFTVHAHVWPEWPGVAFTPYIGAIAGVTSGSAWTLQLENSVSSAGDHAYRSGVYRWHLNEGLWGLIRIV